MKKIVALSLIAAASFTLASCEKKEVVVENNTVVVDNSADAMADTNAALVDSNAVAPVADNASNAS